MNKSAVYCIFNILFITSMITFISGCGTTDSDDSVTTIRVGANLALTGDLPEVGKVSNQSIEMYLENLESSGGVEINGERYQIDIIFKDNNSTAEGAVSAASSLITDDKILIMIGPNASFQAVPTGQLANEKETPMISPWSSDVQTTLNRPWVFRSSFIDSFQGKAIAQFGESVLNATNACVLYADDSDHPKGLAGSFTTEWAALNGTVTASETFQTGDDDLTAQLTTIKNAGCDFILLPQYANEVPAIVEQIHAAGVTVPVIGSDAWGGGGESFLETCGSDCDGYFFVKQFDASGATGVAKEFVDNYQTRYEEVPDDVAALTWDAMLLMEQALTNCGTITGDLAGDRACVRDGLASIQGLESVTGPITYNENGDPLKCASITKIMDGESAYFDTICPE